MTEQTKPKTNFSRRQALQMLAIGGAAGALAPNLLGKPAFAQTAPANPAGRIVVGLSQEPTVFNPLMVHIEVDDCPFSLFEKMHQPFLLWWSNPELELLNKLLRQDIEAAIDAIPAEFRAVLVLVELNGQSYAEAAEALGLPVGTVRSRLARARSRLQRALWEQARDAGLRKARVADA